MKKSIKFLVTIALVAVMGFVFTACEEEPSISIGGTAMVGSTLTAKHDSGSYKDDGGYRWWISEPGSPTNWTMISSSPGTGTYGNTFGANINNKFEIKTLAQGYLIRASRESVDHGRIFSNVLGPILPAP